MNDQYAQILEELDKAEFMNELHDILVKIVPSVWGWDEYVSLQLKEINIHEKESFFGPIEHLGGMNWKMKIRWFIKYCKPQIYPRRETYVWKGHAIGYIEDDKYVAQCPQEFILRKLNMIPTNELNV